MGANWNLAKCYSVTLLDPAVVAVLAPKSKQVQWISDAGVQVSTLPWVAQGCMESQSNCGLGNSSLGVWFLCLQNAKLLENPRWMPRWRGPWSSYQGPILRLLISGFRVGFHAATNNEKRTKCKNQSSLGYPRTF